MKSNATLPAESREILEAINRDAARRRAAIKAITPIYVKAQDFLKSLPNDDEQSVLAHTSLGSYGNVGITLENLEGFKSPFLVSVLEFLLDAGFVPSATNQYTSSRINVDYHFRKTIGKSSVTATVYAYVRSDSPTCRMVVVGEETETVTRQITELRCD